MESGRCFTAPHPLQPPCTKIECAPCVTPQGCSCVCWSPFSGEESACVAAGYSDGTLRIFRLASSEMEMKLQPHHVTITAIHYSAYGETSPPPSVFFTSPESISYLPSAQVT